jgi:ATP-dependent Clp endopeptidase proteolytic subunit ClpP
MISKIKEIVKSLITEGEKANPKAPSKPEPEVVAVEDLLSQVLLLDPGGVAPAEPDMRLIGLFCEVSDEKIAELVHALLYLNEQNKLLKEEERKPVEFYISTYGGSADDMFALYDVMKMVEQEMEIHTIGMGKVMSAGVPLLAAGTKGKRKIGKNCRVMIHSVIAGQHGALHNLLNEMEAIEQIQKMYINCLVENTSMTKKDVKNMLERNVNVYLSAEEAVDLGIADIII